MLFDKPHTLGEFISAVCRIDNEDDAKEFVRAYRQWMKNLPLKDKPVDSEAVIKSNIGWCFGEGMSDEKILLWRKVCDACHPVFGTMEKRPTPEDALAAGMNLAQGAK